MKTRLSCTCIILLAFMSSNLLGQEDAAAASDLAKKSANPIANIISLPFQANVTLGYGDYDRTKTIINIQPVIPFRLNDKWNVVNRIIIPVISQPDNAESGSTFGLGNINYSMFFTPKTGKTFVWGVGPAFNIPTTSDPNLAMNAFGIGPAVVALIMPGHWVAGLTFNKLWSYYSDDLNTFYAQYFITYNISKGWFVNTNPNILANFNAPEGEKWTIPFGLGGGRVIHWGSQPVKLQAQYYYNAIKPTIAADHTIMLMMVFLFTK